MKGQGEEERGGKETKRDEGNKITRKKKEIRKRGRTTGPLADKGEILLHKENLLSALLFSSLLLRVRLHVSAYEGDETGERH